MRLFLVRHGETEENKEKIVQGHMAGHLSKEGIKQAKKLAQRLKNETFDIIYSSDLKRAADTAKIIAKYHDCPLQLTEELREFDCGSYTGVHKSKVDWDNPPSDAETQEQGYSRMQTFLKRVYEEYPKGTVLFVAHAGISRALLAVIRDEKPEDINELMRFSNTAVSVFDIEKENNHKIHILNSSEHLYPTREECLQWYKDLGTPDNILRHVKLVNKLSIFLAKKLQEKGIRIDVDLVDKASLLHDLDKWLCLQDISLRHGYETERILTEKGYPYLGYIARQHRGDLVTNGLKTWEEKVISYSDKRVQQNTIVPLKKRYEYINKTYPAKDKEKRKREMQAYYDLEKEIFSKIDFGPEKLSNSFIEKDSKS